VDQNHNGTIDSTEGVSAIGAQSLIGNRDGLRQTVVDLMQLVRELQAGIDVDGDGHPDLSTSRYLLRRPVVGGIYGTQLLGLEPDIRAGVPNVPGGPIIEDRPPLAGVPATCRARADHADTVAVQQPGAGPPRHQLQREHAAAQPAARGRHRSPARARSRNLIDQTEWAQQAGNPAAYAPYITHPVLFSSPGRQDCPQPDDVRDPACVRLRGPRDALPQ